MTSLEIAARLTWAVLGYLFLVAAWQLAVVPLHVDSFRQRIFSIRRKLFLYMLDGNIDRNSPEYQDLRNLLNAMIRYAEALTFSTIIGGTEVHKYHARRRTGTRSDSCRVERLALSPQVSAGLSQLRTEAMDRLLWHVGLLSPLAWMSITVVTIKNLLRNQGIQRVVRHIQQPRQLVVAIVSHLRRLRKVAIQKLKLLEPAEEIEEELMELLRADNAAYGGRFKTAA